MGSKDTPPIGLDELKRHCEALFAFETKIKQAASDPAPKPTVSSLEALAQTAAAPKGAVPEAKAEVAAPEAKLLSFRDAKKKP